MISNELLSEVLNKDVISFDFSMYRNINYKVNNDYGSSINIYELAHKCKDWANKQGYDVLSSCNSDGRVWVQLHEYDTKLIGSTEYFHSFSEVEAIIKASQWILDNKKEEN